MLRVTFSFQINEHDKNQWPLFCLKHFIVRHEACFSIDAPILEYTRIKLISVAGQTEKSREFVVIVRAWMEAESEKIRWIDDDREAMLATCSSHVPLYVTIKKGRNIAATETKHTIDHTTGYGISPYSPPSCLSCTLLVLIRHPLTDSCARNESDNGKAQRKTEMLLPLTVKRHRKQINTGNVLLLSLYNVKDDIWSYFMECYAIAMYNLLDNALVTS